MKNFNDEVLPNDLPSAEEQENQTLEDEGLISESAQGFLSESVEDIVELIGGVISDN